MADLPSRTEREREIAAAIAAILAKHRAEWQSATVEPQETERELREKLLALLAALFVLGSGTAAGELGVALVAGGAARTWADTYSTFLARRVLDGIRGRILGARDRDPLGVGGLEQAVLDSIVSEKTWGNFSATETTRAYTAGGEFAVTVYNIGRADTPGDFLPEPALAYWHTSQDDRVCPICKPLDGRPRDEWERVVPLGPPAHHVCRCWIDYAVAE